MTGSLRDDDEWLAHWELAANTLRARVDAGVVSNHRRHSAFHRGPHHQAPRFGHRRQLMSICKSNMHNPMTLRQTMPLMMQVLAEHFSAECEELRATGLIISDWSAQHLDEHLSTCVGSYVATQGLPLHPSVYYASSQATVPIQVADLVAGATRMKNEGALTETQSTCSSPLDARLRYASQLAWTCRWFG